MIKNTKSIWETSETCTSNTKWENQAVWKIKWRASLLTNTVGIAKNSNTVMTYSAVSEAGSSGIAKKTQLHKIVNMTR